MPNYEIRESYGEVSVSQIYIPIVPNRVPTYRIRPAQAVEKILSQCNLRVAQRNWIPIRMVACILWVSSELVVGGTDIDITPH